MTLLLTGGAGYIGSHTCVEALKAGFDVVVADDLSNSCEEALRRVETIAGRKLRFFRTELCDLRQVEELFDRCPEIGAVIHFAGKKAVGESVAKPLDYYTNNLVGTLNLLNVMKARGVKNLVFSSSATVYGDPDPKDLPLKEEAPVGRVTNPYGATKYFIERILTDCCAADPGFNAAILRYFNPIGAHESGLIGEDPEGIPNNLVPYIAQVAAGQREKLSIYGDDYPTPDGTGVRDYIHVTDLALGHLAALKKLESGCGLLVCNLGTGRGHSVREVLRAYEKACGRALPYQVTDRRPGDVAVCYADPSRARKELGWTAQRGLEEMCASSWNWQSQNPKGYPK